MQGSFAKPQDKLSNPTGKTMKIASSRKLLAMTETIIDFTGAIFDKISFRLFAKPSRKRRGPQCGLAGMESRGRRRRNAEGFRAG